MPVATTAANLMLAVPEVGVISDTDIIEMVGDIDTHTLSPADQELLAGLPSAILKYRPEMGAILQTLAGDVDAEDEC